MTGLGSFYPISITSPMVGRWTRSRSGIATQYACQGTRFEHCETAVPARWSRLVGQRTHRRRRQQRIERKAEERSRDKSSDAPIANRRRGKCVVTIRSHPACAKAKDDTVWEIVIWPKPLKTSFWPRWPIQSPSHATLQRLVFSARSVLLFRSHLSTPQCRPAHRHCAESRGEDGQKQRPSCWKGSYLPSGDDISRYCPPEIGMLGQAFATFIHNSRSLQDRRSPSTYNRRRSLIHSPTR